MSRIIDPKDFDWYSEHDNGMVVISERPRTPVRGVFYRKALDGKWYWVKKLLGIYWFQDRK